MELKFTKKIRGKEIEKNNFLSYSKGEIFKVLHCKIIKPFIMTAIVENTKDNNISTLDIGLDIELEYYEYK